MLLLLKGVLLLVLYSTDLTRERVQFKLWPEAATLHSAVVQAIWSRMFHLAIAGKCAELFPVQKVSIMSFHLQFVEVLFSLILIDWFHCFLSVSLLPGSHRCRCQPSERKGVVRRSS
jgi:hypothetical protein